MFCEGQQSKNDTEIGYLLWECVGNGYQLCKLALCRPGSRSWPDGMAVCGLLHHPILTPGSAAAEGGRSRVENFVFSAGRFDQRIRLDHAA